MLQSKLFSRTRREAPSDEVSKNANLLARAGFIYKEMAGVYSFLPLGLMTLNRIVDVIRVSMNSLGAQEIKMSALQDKKPWQDSDRWDDKKVDNWFKTKLKNETELGLAFSHEEPITKMLKDHFRSFRDLPIYLYQFQTKFRNEIRAKSGILRTREFLMKDMYSFSPDEESHGQFYDRVKTAYKEIFNIVGIGQRTFLTLASGGSFSKFSHEFQTETDAGEDTAHYCQKCDIAVNNEIIETQKCCPVCQNDNLQKKKTVEVGNIFNLGTRFSEALGLQFQSDDGTKKMPIMGSYGIGPARVLGAVAEILSDEAGLVWPLSISPFLIHLVVIEDAENEAKSYTSKIYEALVDKGISVLYDDREARVGEKFADCDLIGAPYRVVVSQKTLAKRQLEVRERKSGNSYMINESEVIQIAQKWQLQTQT